MKLKYIFGLSAILALSACGNDDGDSVVVPEPVVIQAGSADFSNYVALGNSLTAGFTDGALFQAAQLNSMPNILAKTMKMASPSLDFNQPMMGDNIGGMVLPNGDVALAPRLFFNGTGPQVLNAKPTTVAGVPASGGPFNNMGVPGAQVGHLLHPGYGMLNPYYGRMASNPMSSTIIEDATNQNPTFFTLWIGNNDVLGYATAGGDASAAAITNTTTFTAAYQGLISQLTANGVKGAVANIPDVTSIPHFTTVPYNPVPMDKATAAQVNAGFAAYNGGLQQALMALKPLGLLTDEEVAKRTIEFKEGQNAVVIIDESLTDLGAINPAFAAIPQYRQATMEDLLVLPASSFIGTTVGGNAALINGVSVPLADKWVLTPEEQQEIKDATVAFNNVISSAASAAGLAMVDANTLLNTLKSNGLPFDSFVMRPELVLGGTFSLDGIHLTARGNALMANEFMKAIDATYGSNLYDAKAKAGDFGVGYSPTLQ